MLDIEPDDDLALVAETARKFATEELAPRLREAETNRSVHETVRRLHAEIGLASLELPESLGGAELGLVARALVNEELAAADPGAAIALDPIGPALYPVAELGGISAIASLQEHLGKVDKDARVALVFSEDVSFQIDGDLASAEIPWLPITHVGAIVYVSHTEAILITEDIHTTSLRGGGLRAAGAVALRIDRAPIANRWRAPAAAACARAKVRVANAAHLLGVMRHSCEFSRAYALERHAFGRPIAHHQALAFMMTDMQMGLDGARLLVHEAAWMLDQGIEASVQAAAALAQCIESARFIGPAGVQILGGHGFMADYPMEKAMREVRALSLLYGGLDAAITDAGTGLCDAGAPASLGVPHPSHARGSA